MRIKALRHDWIKNHLADIISITYYSPEKPATYYNPADYAEIEADIFVGFFDKIKINNRISLYVEGSNPLEGTYHKVVNGYIPIPCDFYDTAIEIAEDGIEDREFSRQFALEAV